MFFPQPSIRSIQPFGKPIKCRLGLFILFSALTHPAPVGGAKASNPGSSIEALKDELSQAPVQRLEEKKTIHQAIQYIENERLEEARVLLDSLGGADHSISQQQGAYWYYRGLLYARLAQKNFSIDSDGAVLLEKTLASYRKVLAEFPKELTYKSFVEADLKELWARYLDRGQRYYRKGAYHRARDNYALCKKIDPNNYEVDLYMAMASHKQEDFITAREEYEAYLKKGGQKVEAYYGKALVLERLKQPEKALEIIYDEALPKDPYHEGLLDLWVSLLKQLNQVEGREKALQEVIQERPVVPTHIYWLAHLYKRTEKPTEALIMAQKAAEVGEKEGAIHYALAVQYYNKAVREEEGAKKLPLEEFEKQKTGIRKSLAEVMKAAKQHFEKAQKLKAETKTGPRVKMYLDKIETYLKQLEEIEEREFLRAQRKKRREEAVAQQKNNMEVTGTPFPVSPGQSDIGVENSSEMLPVLPPEADQASSERRG